MNPYPRSHCSFLLLPAIGLIALFSGVSKGATEFGGATPLQWSLRLADSEMARSGQKLAYDADSGKDAPSKWDYAAGMFTLSLIKLGDVTSRPDFVAFAGKTTGSMIDEKGEIAGYKSDDDNLDNLNSGKTLLALYSRTGEDRYRLAAAKLRAQLNHQPRTSEGGFWHKRRYANQMWLDGLYMGSPFYAEYGLRFNELAAFDDVANQIRLAEAHTFDAKTGLYYHGWDESKTQDWANKTTGTSPNFWSRAIGWYAMALVDDLDFFPLSHSGRAEILAALERVAAGIAKYQDPKTGLWYQVTDQGARAGNYLEATASSMFVYALAKGVNNGYLPKNYADVARKGYEGIIRNLVKPTAQGRYDLTQCCKVAGLGSGRDGSYDYYIKEPIVANDLKGVGPFIFAGIELEKLLNDPVGWDRVARILEHLRDPKFPSRDFSILDYGASTDGKSDSTRAIRKAIEACNAAGGGRVVVPRGTYATGAIYLKSNVNLHLEKSATLLFSTDPASYQPNVLTRWEGVECYNFSALIYAYGEKNIAVTGKGTLDGQADWANWWGWVKKDPDEKGGPNLARASRNQLNTQSESGVPVANRAYGLGHYLRPNFIQPYRCRDVLIEGVTILRSPMWEVHPVLCSNVTVRSLEIVSRGPNNDGCDPESCRDVLIEKCNFTTGDDCIAIKSGRNNDGRRLLMPSQNLIVRQSVMRDGHGGVSIGSEISGDCRYVFIEDCKMDSPALDRALRLKTNAVRGGTIENVYMRNVEVGRVSNAVISIDFRYEEAEKGSFLPTVRNIFVENVTSRSSPRALLFVGFEKTPIRNVQLRNCTFSGVEGPDTIKFVENLEKINVKVVQK